MSHPIPVDPSSVLDLTSETRIGADVAVTLAKQHGFWMEPYADAATSLDEMTIWDIYYWIYKSAHPVLKPEPGVHLMTDPKPASLPEDFTKQASVTIGAAGDLLQSAGLEQADGELYADIAELLFGQDVSFANFESPVTRQPLVPEVIGDKGPPIECCSEAQFDVLKGHGGHNFSALNVANNHIWDRGAEGIDATLECLDRNGILDVGTNRRPEDQGRGKMLERNGITLGFAATTFGLNGHVPPEGQGYRVNVSTLLSTKLPPDPTLLQRQIDDCRARGADFVIASIHWGYEFEMFPRLKQIEMAHALAEYGADAILCHHPHVVQPVEYYRTRRDARRVVPIAYSLGSLIWGFSAPHLATSLIMNLTVAKGMIDGKPSCYVAEARATPVVRRYDMEDGRVVARIKRA